LGGIPALKYASCPKTQPQRIGIEKAILSSVLTDDVYKLFSGPSYPPGSPDLTIAIQYLEIRFCNNTMFQSGSVLFRQEKWHRRELEEVALRTALLWQIHLIWGHGMIHH